MPCHAEVYPSTFSDVITRAPHKITILKIVFFCYQYPFCLIEYPASENIHFLFPWLSASTTWNISTMSTEIFKMPTNTSSDYSKIFYFHALFHKGKIHCLPLTIQICSECTVSVLSFKKISYWKALHAPSHTIPRYNPMTSPLWKTKIHHCCQVWLGYNQRALNKHSKFG